MFAARHNQENLAHSRQVHTKQAPSTRGAQLTETPGKHGNENVKALLPSKTSKHVLGGIVTRVLGGKGGQIPMTPMQRQTRAPLGAKTTNAKVKSGQPAGGKTTIAGSRNSYAKHPTTRKAQCKPLLQVGQRSNPVVQSDDEEPEYAPPRSFEAPYQSELLPAGGLTFESLQSDKLLRGYYEHFVNPIDEDGISLQDRYLRTDKAVALQQAEAYNQAQVQSLNWNIADLKSAGRTLKGTSETPNIARGTARVKLRDPGLRRQSLAKRSMVPGRARPPSSTLYKQSESTAGPPRNAQTRAWRLSGNNRPGGAKPPTLIDQTRVDVLTEAATKTLTGHAKEEASTTAPHRRMQRQALQKKDTTVTSAEPKQHETSAPTQSQSLASRRDSAASVLNLCFVDIVDSDTENGDMVFISEPAIMDDEEDFELPPIT